MARERAAPEPPALQAVLEELREADLAAVKEREREILLTLDPSAHGPRLCEWLERQRKGRERRR